MYDDCASDFCGSGLKQLQEFLFLVAYARLASFLKKTQKVETTFKYFLLNHARMFYRQGEFHYTFSNGLEDLHVRENSVIATDMLCPTIPHIRTVFGFSLKN